MRVGSIERYNFAPVSGQKSAHPRRELSGIYNVPLSELDSLSISK